MKVSVIIPVHNGSAYLVETLESVFAQTCAPHEIIAVDDGSSDSSPQLLASFGDRVKIVRQPNQGVAAARNAGLAHASGDLISFLDQDDLWPRDRTRVMVEALRAQPDAQVAAGLVEMLYQRTERTTDVDLSCAHREYLVGSICVRAGLFAALGPFHTGIGYADDTDFMIRRLETNTKTLYLPEVTLIYRVHAGNTSIDNSVSQYHLMAALRERLKRRRGGNEDKLRHPGP